MFTRPSYRAILAAAALSMLPSLAGAQQDGPAERPPVGYGGREYVDSRGCVFLRAEIGGSVAWVARLDAARLPVCGATPTFGAAAEARDAAAPPAAPLPPAIDPAPSAPQPAETARTAAASEAAAAAEAPKAAPAGRAPDARPARKAAAAPLIEVPRAAPHRHPPLSQTKRRRAEARSAAPALPSRIAVPAPKQVQVPQGYRPAWSDGRLNPDRGKQTLSGALQTALIWTQTVPRRLIDRRTGRDVTREYNYILYPYTDYAKQKRDLGAGTHVVVRFGSGERIVVPRSRLRVGPDGQVRLRLSSKSAGAAATLTDPGAAAPAPRYVQVGAFAQPRNAEAMIGRLRAAGLPVATRSVGNGRLQAVMAGPFADGPAARQALAALRRAGMADAFLR